MSWSDTEKNKLRGELAEMKKERDDWLTQARSLAVTAAINEAAKKVADAAAGKSIIVGIATCSSHYDRTFLAPLLVALMAEEESAIREYRALTESPLSLGKQADDGLEPTPPMLVFRDIKLYTQQEVAILAGYAQPGGGNVRNLMKRFPDRFVEGEHYVLVGKKAKFTEVGVCLIRELTGFANQQGSAESEEKP